MLLIRVLKNQDERSALRLTEYSEQTGLSYTSVANTMKTLTRIGVFEKGEGGFGLGPNAVKYFENWLGKDYELLVWMRMQYDE